MIRTLGQVMRSFVASDMERMIEFSNTSSGRSKSSEYSTIAERRVNHTRCEGVKGLTFDHGSANGGSSHENEFIDGWNSVFRAIAGLSDLRTAPVLPGTDESE